MKKIFSNILLIFLLLNNFVVFSLNNLEERFIYYMDKDNNGKIDTLEIEFNNTLTGSLNLEKIFFYSNTGGLSVGKIDSISGTNLLENYYLSGNILGISLIEQDNYLTGLIINNTTSSHLRIKTNSGVGIKDLFGNEIKLLYTSSFDNYKNTEYKYIFNELENNNDTNYGNIIYPEEEELNEENISNTGGLVQEEEFDYIEETEDFTYEEIEDIISELDNINSELENDLSLSGVLNNEEDIINIDEILSDIINTPDIPESNFSGTVKLVFQSPTYLLEPDIEKDIYFCDTGKTDCRVNYNLNINNTNISTSKYSCKWDFGFNENTGEEEKCNPNTITYPLGEYKTTFKISEKSNTGNFYEREFFIKNDGYKEEKTITKSVVYVYGNNNSNIEINTPEIIVQSGLDENKNCKKEDCQVNFLYEQNNPLESCLWLFPGGNFSEGNDKKCNPTYVKYPLGDFKVTLRVYETGNSSNFKESYFYFSNKKIDSLEEKKYVEFENDNYNELIAKISLQGTLGSNKTLSGNILTCSGECSVNFDGSESIGEKLKYFWDFGNGENSDVKNPKSQKYYEGIYKITLRITDKNGNESEDYFFVNILSKSGNQEKYEEIENVNLKDYKLKITKVLPNPVGSDNLEFIEIENYGESEINLKGCILDDGIDIGSKPYKFKDEIIKPNETKKYYKYETGLNLNNTGKEEVNILCFGNLIDNFSFDFKYPEGFIIERDLENINQVKKLKENGKYEVYLSNGEKINIEQNYEMNVFENILKGDLPKEEKIDKIKEVINKSFTQKVSKQKSGVKIYGNSIPNSLIILKLEETKDEEEFSFLNLFYTKALANDDIYELKTDNFGYYEKFIEKPNIGNYEIKTLFKIYEDNLIELEKKSNLEIDDDYIEYISSNKTKETKKEEVFAKPKSVILVQGKSTVSKKIQGNKITCYFVEYCSVNFDGRESLGNKLTYFWNFGNLTTFDKSNPSSYKFYPGIYTVSLTVKSGDLEDTSYFVVEVISDKIEDIDEEKNIENIFIDKAKASNGENENFKNLYKSFIYTFILVIIFFILSFIILKKKLVFSSKETN